MNAKQRRVRRRKVGRRNKRLNALVESTPLVHNAEFL